MVCPRDLRAGDPKEYIKKFLKMLADYRAGNYVDVTNKRL